MYYKDKTAGTFLPSKYFDRSNNSTYYLRQRHRRFLILWIAFRSVITRPFGFSSLSSFSARRTEFSARTFWAVARSLSSSHSCIVCIKTERCPLFWRRPATIAAANFLLFLPDFFSFRRKRARLHAPPFFFYFHFTHGIPSTYSHSPVKNTWSMPTPILFSQEISSNSQNKPFNV